MGKLNSIKLNFVMNFILSATNIIFPLISFPYVSRILLSEGTGKVAFAISVVNYFTLVAALGIPTYGIKACAVVRDDKEKLSKTVQELFIIHGFSTLVVAVCFLAAIYFVPKLSESRVLLMIAGSNLILNLFGVNWLYSALEQYTYITIRSVVFKLISLVSMFCFIKAKDDYPIYCAVSVLASAGSNILNFVNLRKYVSLRFTGHYNFKRHLKPIIILFAQTMSITVYANLDTVMLGFMKNDTEVGLYDAAVKMKTVLVQLVTSLGTVLLPRLSYLIESGKKDDFYKLVMKAIEFVAIASFPLSIYCMMFAEDIIVFLSGESFREAATAMITISPTIIFIGFSNLLGIQILVPLGKEKIVLLSVVSGAILDLIINCICIPRFGAAGAAFGTTCAEALVLLVQIVYLKELVKVAILKVPWGKIGIALLCSIIPTYYTRIMNGNLIIKILLSGSIFFGIYGIMLIILKEQLVYQYVSEYKKKLGYIINSRR